MKRSLVILTLLSAFMALPGCGGGLTDAQRVSYFQENQQCNANEQAIIHRTGTTREQDQADFAAERARCNAALSAILGVDAGVTP